MADITKKVGRDIAPPFRSQNFTRADAAEGDILLIEDSLGHPASHVTIEADLDMRVRFNVYYTVFPRRFGQGWDSMSDADHLYELSSGVQVQRDDNGFIDIEAGATYEFERDMPIADIELITVSGNFDIWCT